MFEIKLTMKSITLLICGFVLSSVYAQNYTSYFTGNVTDLVATPSGGVCLMGGATEEDEAMKWFLQRANGGDVLVLRASGSDGYNDYFYTDLGVSVNSVETIVFNDATASSETYIHQKIMNAEAIWFAGGDQWNYISYWRGNTISDLINDGIENRSIVVGGTSAGMAILGGYYFSAENGTVTSPVALANPYDNNITVDSEDFLHAPYISNVISDTHYDNPDRKGRQVTFIARTFTDDGIEIKGIACDEYTAVCIDENGIAHVYGQFPSYDDNAYFIQTNCELANRLPETCTNNTPLNWNLGGEALKVYAVKGTLAGTNTFDLNDWQTGNGGVWQNWYVDNGTLLESNSTAINCTANTIDNEQLNASISVYPNPFSDVISISSNEYEIQEITLFDQTGRIVMHVNNPQVNTLNLETDDLENGVYIVAVKSNNSNQQFNIVKQ